MENHDEFTEIFDRVYTEITKQQDYKDVPKDKIEFIFIGGDDMRYAL